MSGEYFREWYSENAEALNERRRYRYATDPEYRKKVQESNARNRKLRREAKRAEKRVESAARLVRHTKRPWRTVTAEVKQKGKKARAEVYTIGCLADRLGCSVQVIRLWEDRGVIPETPLRGVGGDRLYTAEMIEMIASILKSQGRLGRGVRSLLRWSKRKVRIGGEVKDEMLFRVGALADAIGRTAATIDQLEQRKMFPKTPFRASSTHYRLYTAEMIEVAKKAFEFRCQPIRGQEWDEIYQEVYDGWDKLGVFDSELLED